MNQPTRAAAVAVVLAAALAAGCATDPVTGERELRLISVDQEVAMGQEAAPEFEKEFGGKLANETLQSYVREVGGRVASKSDRQNVTYEFALLASDVPNAFALPGGKTYVTAGLMEIMTNERQLAAVLGHEITHVAAAHSVDQLQKAMGMELLAKLAGTAIGGSKGEAAEAGAKVAGAMVGLKYSRKHEYEADQYGMLYLTRAGYSPWGMVELLERLASLSEEKPGLIDGMMRTHPYTSDRIERCKELIRTTDAYRGFSPETADPRAAHFRKMHALLLSVRGKKG